MRFVRLGATGTKISCIGFGCAAAGGYDYGVVDDRQSEAAIRRGLELGVNFFDTADVYGFGHAEEVLGKALGRQRQDVVIATKVGVRWDKSGATVRDLRPKTIIEALEASLKRLKLDHIPLYQIHWPDSVHPIEETLDALNRCKEDGMIGDIGCCNFPFSLVERAQRSTRLESIQMPYSLVEKEAKDVIVRSREQYQMSVLSYNSLAHGLLSGKYGKGSIFKGTDLRRRADHFHGEKLERNLAILERIRIVANRLGKTPSQVAIRWVLQNSPVCCAVVGIKTPEQVEDNCEAIGWELSSEEYEFLSLPPLPLDDEECSE